MVVLDPAVAIFTGICIVTGTIVIFRYFPSLVVGTRINGLSLFPKKSSSSSPSIHGTTASASSFSLEKAYASFNAYLETTESEVQAYKSKFKTLRGAHRRFTIALEYPKKISRLEQACSFNATITRGICKQAHADFPILSEWWAANTVPRKDIDVGRVRESLKHLVRDWSREGERERNTIFGPILAELTKIPEVARPHHKVLIPGSGLGRLAWEIAGRGFDTTSCELSYYMNLSLRFLLSSLSTWTTDQHKIQPFAHWWSHQRSNETTFRTISFPDELPRRLENWTIAEEDFLSLSPPTSASSRSKLTPGGYDTIVTLYFIDTASNIISYLQHIHYLLKPGGKWINLGPLLYSNASMELNLEEVLKLADMIGFNVNSSSRRQIPSEYTADQHAMMKWIYQAEFWVASKRVDEPIV